MTDKTDKNLIVQSIVAVRDNQPYVQIMLNDASAQFTPEEARDLGVQLTQAASAAEADAAIYRFIAKLGGGKASPEATAAALAMFREVRQESERNPARAKWDEMEGPKA